MVRRMSDLEIHQVKLLICEGFSQVEAARAIGISAAHVSRICSGDIHRDIPWPNPEVGEKLMKATAFRGKQDEVQAQLSRGIAQAPQVIETTEAEAIEQAKQQAANRAEMKKQIEEAVEKLEKEEQEEFIESMQPKGPKSTKEVEKMPTAWEVSFLPWEEVLDRAGGNSIVEAIKDTEDEILQRAIGIVFCSLDPKEWDAEQTPRMIEAVAEQLEGAKR